MKNSKIIRTLILSGGGAKGIVYAGVLKKIDEIQNDSNNEYDLEIKIDEIFGVSVGSIFGFLYSIGYTGNELVGEIYKMKTKRLQNLKIVNLLNEWGLDNGDSVIDWITELCKAKGINHMITFSELYTRFGINLRIGVTNLNKYRFDIFDKENSADTSILRIIRLSFSLPIIYTKAEFSGDLYSDGGITNNYPIQYYKDGLDSVIGVKILSEGELESDISININSFEEYIFNIIYCYMIDKERKLTLNSKYSNRTIFIKTSMKNPVNSKLKTVDKRELLTIGYISTEQYFKRYKYKLKVE